MTLLAQIQKNLNLNSRYNLNTPLKIGICRACKTSVSRKTKRMQIPNIQTYICHPIKGTSLSSILLLDFSSVHCVRVKNDNNIILQVFLVHCDSLQKAESRAKHLLELKRSQIATENRSRKVKK